MPGFPVGSSDRSVLSGPTRSHAMRNREKLMLGALAGVGAVWGVRAWLRARRWIELTDRVIIITGASTGMGFLAAKEAAGQGAHLVLAARSPDELEAAGRDLRELGAAS